MGRVEAGYSGAAHEVLHGVESLRATMAAFHEFDMDEGQLVMESMIAGRSFADIQERFAQPIAVEQEQGIPECGSYTSLFVAAEGNSRTLAIYGHFGYAYKLALSFARGNQDGISGDEFLSEAFAVILPDAVDSYLRDNPDHRFIAHLVRRLQSRLIDMVRRERQQLSVVLPGQQDIPSRKRERAYHFYLSELLSENERPIEDMLTAPQPNPVVEGDMDETLAEAELVAQVRQAYGKLTPALQKTLAAYLALDGARYAKIGAKIGKTEHAVKINMSRAIAALRRYVTENNQ